MLMWENCWLVSNYIINLCRSMYLRWLSRYISVNNLGTAFELICGLLVNYPRRVWQFWSLTALSVHGVGKIKLSVTSSLIRWKITHICFVITTQKFCNRCNISSYRFQLLRDFYKLKASIVQFFCCMISDRCNRSLTFGNMPHFNDTYKWKMQEVCRPDVVPSISKFQVQQTITCGNDNNNGNYY